MNLSVLRILLGLLGFSPLHGDSDHAFRWELATAIASVTDDAREQDVLTRIAWYESSLRRSVARCDVKGDRGKSLGIFQVQPMTPSDARAACGAPAEQAALALRYVRRSAEMCPSNVGAMRLALYVSGRCDRGARQARERWGEE